MIRSYYNQITHLTDKTKSGKSINIHHIHALIYAHERQARLMEWSALVRTGGHSASLILKTAATPFYLFSSWKLHNRIKQVAEWTDVIQVTILLEFIHTNIITGNIEKPQQQHRLWAVSNRYLGGLKFDWIQTLTCASAVNRNIWPTWKCPDSSGNYHMEQINLG